MAGGGNEPGLLWPSENPPQVKAEVYRDGKIYMQEYVRGKPKGPVKAVGETKETGTKITFKADHQIFPKIIYSRKTIIDHVRQQAYLTKGIHITIIDSRKEENIPENDKYYPKNYSFHFEGGIAAYVSHLVRPKQALITEPIYFFKTIY